MSIEHPLVGSLDHLTPDELSSKIAELNKKLVWAMRSGNANLCNQIRLALSSFQAEYQARIQKSADTPYTEVIDIS